MQSVSEYFQSNTVRIVREISILTVSTISIVYGFKGLAPQCTLPEAPKRSRCSRDPSASRSTIPQRRYDRPPAHEYVPRTDESKRARRRGRGRGEKGEVGGDKRREKRREGGREGGREGVRKAHSYILTTARHPQRGIEMSDRHKNRRKTANSPFCTLLRERQGEGESEAEWQRGHSHTDSQLRGAPSAPY